MLNWDQVVTPSWPFTGCYTLSMLYLHVIERAIESSDKSEIEKDEYRRNVPIHFESST